MNLDRFFNFQTKTITSSAAVLAIATLISRALGLVRDGLLAGRFGAGVKTDIYFAAFRIPDLIYNILIAGGLVVAFLPLFSEYYSKNKEKAWEVVNYILNTFLVLLVLICLALFFFTPSLLKIIAPGFSSSQRELAVSLTRLMFLSPIFFGLSSVFSGILHYFNRFLVYSLAPLLYNLGIIFGILFLAPKFGVLGVGLGVVLGAFLHFAIQVPSAKRCGFRYRFLISFKKPAIRRAFRLMVPRSFAMAGQQINLIVITAIASTITTGSIAIFNFANNIRYLPIGLIGVPFAIASFPALSKGFAGGKKELFLKNFSRTFREILFFVTPFSLLMFILRAHLVRLILGTLGKEFGWWETRLTAACLGLFCLGIFGASLIVFLSRAFFALKNTKTPALIILAGVALNIGLSFFLVWVLGFSNFFSEFLRSALRLSNIENIAVIGLGLAFSLALIFQFLLLLIFFFKKINKLWSSSTTVLKEIWVSFEKVVLASLAMSGFTYLTLYLIAGLVNTKTVLGLFLQTLGAGLIAALVYIGVAFLLRSAEVYNLKLLLKKIKDFKLS